jgi:hypothetical protein
MPDKNDKEVPDKKQLVCTSDIKEPIAINYFHFTQND